MEAYQEVAPVKHSRKLTKEVVVVVHAVLSSLASVLDIVCIKFYTVTIPEFNHKSCK